MIGRLQRIADTPFGVFGVLELLNGPADDVPQKLGRWWTLEDDWLNNEQGKSCIPAGHYVCRRSVWHKTGVPTFEVTRVPHRSRILLHWGNTEENVEGCILLGSDLGALTVADEDAPGTPARPKWAVTGSRAAFDAMMLVLTEVNEFPLVIEWAEPGAWRSS